jgi:hypothetical protein
LSRSIEATDRTSGANVRHPQIVISAFDDWLGKQLAQLAAEHRWLIAEHRQRPAALAAVRENRPTVLLAQIDPKAEDPRPAFQFLADVHRLAPGVAGVAVSDVKLNDDDRASWTAAVLDFGVRYVLFPPLSRPILEDVVGGLMTAVVRRTVWGGPAVDGPIDLADPRMRA